jgi:glycogen debranching enzyme
MVAGWNDENHAMSAGFGAVTIVEGAAFCVSDDAGDISPDRPQGFFFDDTRMLSSWSLRVNGHVIDPLSVMTPQPYRAIFVGRAGHTAGRPETSLIVERARRVGAGLREDVTLQNFSEKTVHCTVEFVLDVDFADIFEVKDGHPRRQWAHSAEVNAGEIILTARWEEQRRGAVVSAPGGRCSERSIIFDLIVPARGEATVHVSITPTINGKVLAAEFPIGEPIHTSRPAQRFIAWHSDAPVTSSASAAMELLLHRSQEDLGSLRIFNSEHPERAVVAAGAPWFMALFGRDSILTAIMTLPLDPTLALGTLRTLADLQGTEVNFVTEEQPGRILHEVRLGVEGGLALGGGNVYYGTVDATPLFVVAVGELIRWGIPIAELADLLPHVDRALSWIDLYGDRDGDGFVEYERISERGLLNQGWKDSWDAINFANGEMAQTPIALSEVQGYVYAAFLARALIAHELHEEADEAFWNHRAESLKKEFNERFWMPELGYFAIALDRDKRPVDSCASNMGHCLWSGIIDTDKAAPVIGRLMGSEMFSGWGIRTLASTMGAFNPASYHNGSVWPHENALIAAGMMRYGFIAEAQRLATAVFDVADQFDGRLPELFCGFDRTQYSSPVRYPTACSPQAWAAAAPLLLLRTLLRLEPRLNLGQVWLDPAVPESFGNLRIENVPLGGVRVSIDIVDGVATILGLPPGLTVRTHHNGVSPSSPHETVS